MSLNRFLTITLIISSITFFSFSVSHKDSYYKSPSTDTTKSLLTLYGQYIFTREKCLNCHSFTQTKDKKIISLDGLKNKYPKSWHYYHILDPTSVVINSTMPSFESIIVNTFSQDSINKNIEYVSIMEWERLIVEAKLIRTELNEQGIDIDENSEVIALAAFLDDIPESEELKLIRIKEAEKIAIEKKYFDSLWTDPDYKVNLAIHEKHSSKKGKEIFKKYCTPCHGKNGEGVIGPNLTDDYWLHGGSNENVANTIINGVSDRGMLPWRYQLTPSEIGQLVSYIKSLKGTNPANGKSQQGIKE